MKVKDQEIKRVLVNAYNKDHSGLTRSDVDVVTLFKWDTFNGNTVIEDFSDFGDIFRNVTTIEGSAFAGCKNLKFFSLPIHQKVSIEDRGFDNTALDERSIDFSRVSKLGKWAFRYACFKHVYILFGIDLSNAIEAFSSNDDLIKLEVGEGYTFVRRFAQNCPKLIKLVYPATTEIVEGSMLHGCNSIQSFVMKSVV